MQIFGLVLCGHLKPNSYFSHIWYLSYLKHRKTKQPKENTDIKDSDKREKNKNEFTTVQKEGEPILNEGTWKLN